MLKENRILTISKVPLNQRDAKSVKTKQLIYLKIVLQNALVMRRVYRRTFPLGDTENLELYAIVAFTPNLPHGVTSDPHKTIWPSVFIFNF